MNYKFISFLVFVGCISYGSAMDCKKEGLFGITTYISCPQIGQPSNYNFCCGSEENRYCCQFPLEFDQETVDKIVENDLGGQSHGEDAAAAAAAVHSRSERQTNKITDTNTVETPIVPQKANETEGRISDAVQKAKDKVKQKIKDKSKDKINKVIEEKTQRNLPRLIGILVGVVLVVLLVCVVCCCCCPFCLLAKRRNRTRGDAEVTVTPPPQQAAQPLQPYPQQPYPPQQYPNTPAAGYPDQPPPYAEKQPASNPNYNNV